MMELQYAAKFHYFLITVESKSPEIGDSFTVVITNPKPLHMKKIIEKFINDRGFYVTYSGKDNTMYIDVMKGRRLSKPLIKLNTLGLVNYAEQVIEETKEAFPNLPFKLSY